MTVAEFSATVKRDQKNGEPSQPLIAYVAKSAALYCKARGQSDADAADIAQNVALKFVLKFMDIDISRSPAAYLASICRTERFKYLKRACTYSRVIKRFSHER